MDSNDFIMPKSPAKLRASAARAKKLACAAMDVLTIARLEQLAREYEAEAASIERSEDIER